MSTLEIYLVQKALFWALIRREKLVRNERLNERNVVSQLKMNPYRSPRIKVNEFSFTYPTSATYERRFSLVSIIFTWEIKCILPSLEEKKD